MACVQVTGGAELMGSALTYARRYSLFSIVGIAGEDDDGNAASTSTPARDFKGRNSPPKPSIAFVSADQAAQLGDAVKACGKGNMGTILAIVENLSS